MRRIALGLAGLVVASLSCGREPTSPDGTRSGARVVRSQGIAFATEFPAAYPLFQASGSGAVDFTKVRIILNNPDGSVALDTVVDFPAGATELPVTLSVPLPASTPASGLPLTLNLKYVNAAGDIVFTGGPVTVNAVPVPPGGPAPPPASVTIPLTYTGPGANATAVRIAPKTLTVNTGATFNFSAQALDASGKVVPNTPIVFASQNQVLAAVNATTGVGAAGSSRGTVGIVAQLLTGPTDVATLTITSPPASIAAVSGSGLTAAAGATLAQPVVVQVNATDGLPATGVAVAFAAQNGGTAGAASVNTDASGRAQTTWTLGTTPGTQTLTASATGLSGSPVTFTATATPVTPVRLAYVTQPPASTAAGTVLAPAIQVRAEDATGALTPGFTGAVTVALGAGAPTGAILSGTPTTNAVAGVATFDDLKVNVPGSYTLVASATALTGATSDAFTIVAGTAKKLAFQNYPVIGAVAGVLFDPITVVARDSVGNIVTSYAGAVTLGAVTATGAALRVPADSATAGVATPHVPTAKALTGTTTVNAVAGVATFTGIRQTTAGSFALTASAAGLTDVTGPAFTITPGPATTLVLVSGGGQSAAGAATLGNPVVVQVTDGFGNGVGGATVNFAPVAASGSASPASATTDAGGLAQTTWTLGGVAGADTMNVAGSGLTPNPLIVTATATSTIAGGTPHHLSITSGPTNTTAGAVIAPSITVSVMDATNALVSAFAGNVTVAITANPGGGTLSGTTTVTAVAGVATFGTLSIDKAGAGYSLTASSGTLITATTSPFNITAGAAARLAFTTQPATVGVGSAITPPMTVTAKDALGNVATAFAGNVTLGMAVNPGAATLGGTTTAVAASGVATFSTVTVSALGTGYRLAATSGTLIPDTSVTFNVTSGVAASTTLNTHLDSLFSLGDTVRKVATSKDAVNNVVAGTYTWVSRNPAVAAVSSVGTITAVANGATYVVVTEAAGTKDSSQVVVQQRVATINVTPGTRNIYLTRSFQFTAAAVDGRGSPVAPAPTFVWSSTAIGTATVDASGNVSAVGLGPVQIRATAGAIIGVSNVTIITPITRIVVGRDSSGTPVTDTTSLKSLGVGRRFVAVAHDTLDAPMAGVTFTWVSTNASVALLDTIGATSSHALAAANGVTSVQAMAQGVTGTVTLNVAQALASIVISAATPTIAPIGTVQLVAHGLDANGRGIATGLAFTYASSATGVATVNSSGVVSGVALGTADMTASSGAITSPPFTITVANTGVPAIISFGRDTLSVGRGGAASVPILLSKPNSGGPVVVNLAVRDTFAFWSADSVSIPANQTSVNATLNGHNAGTTLVYATERSATGYAGDTAVLAVQANVKFAACCGYALNATDQTSTQVLLSDPSPAGGTYVTFGYGTAGKAQVSPDPAFIPQGQLAANVQIIGLTSGSTTVTPSAIGVNGTASTMTIAAANLVFSTTFVRLGQGQYEPNTYVYLPQNNSTPVPLTLTSSDTNVVTVTPVITISSGNNYAYFTVTARGTGSATITVSSPGWNATNSLSVVSTTPHVGISGGGTLNTTSPAQSLAVYAEDSVRTGHYRTSSLVVRLASSDTTVMKVIDSVVTIGAGNYYLCCARVQPAGVLGGTAWIRVTAGGHTADSVQYTVVGPKLNFSWFQNLLGKGQYEPNLYVYSPDNVTAPVIVSVSNSDPTKVSVPAADTIPIGTNYRYFTVSALDTGRVTLIATAPGYQPDTAFYIVTTPRLYVTGGGTMNNFAAGSGYTIYATDSVRNGHYVTAPLTVTVVSRDSTIVRADTIATIGAGAYYVSPLYARPTGVGTTIVAASAPGYGSDSATWSVQTPKLNFSLFSAVIGRRQYYTPTDFYVYTPDSRPVPVPVSVTQKHATVDSLTATALTISANNNYQYFGTAGLSFGTDTLIATATGYVPDTAFVTVSSTRFTGGGIPGSATTTNPPGATTVYATDSLGNGHYVLDTVAIHVTSSDSNVIRPTQAYVHILRGQYYVSPLTFSYVGPGTAHLTYTDSAGVYAPLTSNDVTVTGPSLHFNTTTLTYGMRQQGYPTDVYVYADNNVATPLVVHLVSTSTRVAKVNVDSVTIAAGSNYAYLQVIGQDTLGTIQVQATATGYGAPTPITVQVTQPKFVISTSTQDNTTTAPSTMTIYATDANGNAHYVTGDVTITLASSSPSVATIDSATVTIPAGQYYNNHARWVPGVVGTTQLSAADTRAVFYKYTTGLVNVAVVTPNLNFSWGSTPLGIGQYIDNMYAYTPDNQLAPMTVALSHTGTARIATSTNATNTPISSLTIGTGTNYQYFRIAGTSTGTDTLVATASSPLHNPAQAYTVVGPGRLDPLGSWPSSLRAGDSVQVTLYARDPAQNGRYLVNATAFTLAPNANISFTAINGTTPITSVTIPADQYYVTFWVKGVSAGTGSVILSATNYTTYTPTVTVTP